jgi:hypothetical protein
MKKIFISYGNKYYKDSLKRIGQEADNSKIFDKILLYNDHSLPDPFGIYAKNIKGGDIGFGNLSFFMKHYQKPKKEILSSMLTLGAA